MRNKELERIAMLIAQPGEDRTDGECLGDVWAYLTDCGIDPDDFRGCTCSEDKAALCPFCVVEAEAKAIAEWEDDEPEVAPAMTAQEFLPGTVLQCRSLADYDCVFRFTVLRRTAKQVVLRYFDTELRVAIRKDRDGREYCFPLGKHSMAPMLYAEPF